MNKIIFCTVIFCIAFLALSLVTISAQDKTTGGVKGVVRDKSGDKISNVIVEARQGDKKISTGRTDKSGEFIIIGLKPGVYRFAFNKTGLSEGVTEDVEIKSRTVISLKKLVMSVDLGTLAIIRGSVFDPSGRSVGGAKIEVSKISGGNFEKSVRAYTGESGEFSFRFAPNAAKYRFTVSADNAETTIKEVDVDGAEVYRVVIMLKSKQ